MESVAFANEDDLDSVAVPQVIAVPNENPVRKRRKRSRANHDDEHRLILENDAYEQALGDVIQRNYFPQHEETIVTQSLAEFHAKTTSESNAKFSKTHADTVTSREEKAKRLLLLNQPSSTVEANALFFPRPQNRPQSSSSPPRQESSSLRPSRTRFPRPEYPHRRSHWETTDASDASTNLDSTIAHSVQYELRQHRQLQRPQTAPAVDYTDSTYAFRILPEPSRERVAAALLRNRSRKQVAVPPKSPTAQRSRDSFAQALQKVYQRPVKRVKKSRKRSRNSREDKELL